MKTTRRLDISNNNLKDELKVFKRFSSEIKGSISAVDGAFAPAPGGVPGSGDQRVEGKRIWSWLWILLVIAFFGMLVIMVSNWKVNRSAKDKKILQALAHSPIIASPVKAVTVQEVKQEERIPELVFFVEEAERFKLEDLLEAGADLQSQSFCSSLYKVQLKNKSVYAVKRLKKLHVSSDEFGKTMRKIGELKHPNILPLVAYSSTSEEKLLIYKYQKKRSLLTLLETYIEGKRGFPWKHRLLIAVGIARGLDHIYRSGDHESEEKIIPHGNIKLSNIMLNENEEPLISEYRYSKFLDPRQACLFNSNGYTAPEKMLTEQTDVFSFGMILLELLTGKNVEKSGLDLPKWVKAMVREEWTREVFDKEIAKAGKYAFPLLNIALKCVAHFPENRPSVAEVLEKIEEVAHAQEDISASSFTSTDSSPRDGRSLHPVAEEWDMLEQGSAQ